MSTARLPITGPELFGREDELARLNRAWADPHTHVLSLVAWGGVGKSALVNHWLARMAADGYRGAGRVFGWSFYSQGARLGTASADRFVDVALRWLGDPDPSAGSPWYKGERLAERIRARRTLLVLDGLEPLQEPPGPEEGRIKDRKAAAKDLPDTIDEMAPLYAAVQHGCHAGHHQEALYEVYWRRIQHGKEHYNWHRLGAFGADLAVLRGFFDRPWSRPVAGLNEANRAFVLNEAGFDLRALGRLAEAAEPLRAGLEADFSQEDWKNAARAANNLTSLNLAMGDLAQALAKAKQGVELAGRSGEVIERMVCRATLADALHQSGRLSEAATAFREAEDMQKEWQPQYPLLYSIPGYQYCDLLLGQGQHREVLERAGQTLEWATRQRILLHIALDHLSLGRALVYQGRQEGAGDLDSATEHLDQAVQGLRDAGQQDYLPLGLLARVALRREVGELDQARADLDEALTIASRGGMRLHEADARLEQTRLHLALGESAEAAESLAVARQIIEQTGYHRRDSDLADLAELHSPARIQ